ncbi:MAG TPA: HAMP domain-containing sensor histidine kinase [Micromonosporaceae bacterium]|nr:HAMP domain-containing sensor histidine kinase [Micromonosporaceae bacterium]
MSRHSVRLRLALLCGGLVLVTGAVLLSALYLAASQAIAAQTINVPMAEPLQPEETDDLKKQKTEAEEVIRTRLRNQTLTPLRTRGLAALAGLTAAGVGVGWLAAGGVLRPLRQVTATVRRVAERNLHERVALSGPRNEWWELATAVDAMLARLDAAFTAQQQFVGNASHELKTPLAINRTLLEVAMNRPDAPVDLLRLGENLLEVNARHERLVDGLLILTRAARRIADPRPVDLADVVDGALAFLRPEAERHRVKVTATATPVVVDGDRVLLDRLAQNLLQNAIQHNVPDGWLRVDVGPADDAARLVVTNTGLVIPAATVPDLFVPFQRATNRVRSAQGTGLGLSIVQSVVWAHGGTVSARPRDGGGLEVEVTIPQTGNRQ